MNFYPQHREGAVVKEGVAEVAEQLKEIMAGARSVFYARLNALY